MGIRTSREYMEALRDRREIYIRGKKIESVLTDPLTSGLVQTMAEYYDIHHEADYRDVLTFRSPATGNSVSVSYLIPRNYDDLVKKRKMIEFLVNHFGAGFMSRLPEYMSAVLIGLQNIKDELGKVDPKFKVNVDKYYERCQESDLALTHAFGPPQIDRSKGPEAQENLKIVGETRDGVIVDGGRMVATSVVVSDEFLTYPANFPGVPAEYCVYFSIPVATKGVKFICREPTSVEGNRFNRPLSSRYDEIDSFVVFDHVLVPWEKIFLRGDVERAMLAYTDGLQWAAWHVLVRQAIKAETFLGVAALIAEYTGVSQYPNVREQIQEIIVYTEGLRAFVIASEVKFRMTKAGIAMPDPMLVQAGKNFAVQNYPRVLYLIQEIAGSGILMAPTEQDLKNKEIGPYIERYFKGRNIDAKNKLKLFKLAWELTSSSFGARQAFFEYFNFGSPYTNKQQLYSSYDTSEFVKRVKKLAGIDG